MHHIIVVGFFSFNFTVNTIFRRTKNFLIWFCFLRFNSISYYYELDKFETELLFSLMISYLVETLLLVLLSLYYLIYISSLIKFIIVKRRIILDKMAIAIIPLTITSPRPVLYLLGGKDSGSKPLSENLYNI